jgi:hypothetical protein
MLDRRSGLGKSGLEGESGGRGFGIAMNRKGRKGFIHLKFAIANHEFKRRRMQTSLLIPDR